MRQGLDQRQEWLVKPDQGQPEHYQTVLTRALLIPVVSSILGIMYFRRVPNRLFIIWLALLLCVWTTADLVVDLVFEEQEVTANAHETEEATDDVAEHLLFPSDRVGVVEQNTVTTLQLPDLQGFSLTISVLELMTPRAHPPPHPPPRNRPVSFSIPLRI